jgi:hypothetical protein
MMTKMYCAELAEAEDALLAVLNGGNLHLVALDDGARIESSVGALELAGVIGSPPVGAPIDAEAGVTGGAPLLILLLLIPLGFAAAAILVTMTADHRSTRR